jgi:hypothetical protein
LAILTIDTERYMDSARHVAHGHGAVNSAVETALGCLAGSASMSGWDSVGVVWAQDYDPAAGDVIRVLTDLTLAAGSTVGAMNAAAGNYLHTEHAVSQGTSSLFQSAVAVPGETRLPAPPSANGGVPGDPPWMWDVIANGAGLVWPTADTGRLRTTAAGWTALADALDAAVSGSLSAASIALEGLRAADIDLVRERHAGTADATGQLAGACRELAAACSAYAGEVDDARAQLGWEVAQFAALAAVHAVVGAVATAATGGLAAALAAAGLGAQIARVAAVAGSILARLAGAAAAAAARLQPLRGLTAGVSTRLRGLPALSPTALVTASAGRVQPLVHKARALKDRPAVQRLAPAVTVADGFLKGNSFKFLVDGPTKMLGEAAVKAGIKRLPDRFAVSDKFNIVGQSAYLVRNVADSQGRVGRVVNVAGEGYDRIEKVVTAANIPSTYWAQSAPAKTGAGREDTAKPAGAAGIRPPAVLPAARETAAAPAASAAGPVRTASNGAAQG